MKTSIGIVLSGLALAASLAACTPMSAAVGVGAAAGVGVAQEGGLKGAITDKAIYLKISDLWAKSDFDMYRKLTLTVKEGRVLVAGSVPTADMRVNAVRLAWQAEGVRQVINEVKVADGGGFGDFVTDAWITGNVKTRIMFDKYVQSINYNIDTVNGTVYIMGIAQDAKELSRVLDAARTTEYVKNVVSYARLRGETPVGVQPPTSGTPPVYPEDAARGYSPNMDTNGYAPPAGTAPDSGTNPYALPPPQSPMTSPAPVQAEKLGPPA